MKNQLNKKTIEKFSRQIILKNIGIIGQKKILSSKVLIVGAGGLGCPVAEFLARAGVGFIGIVDNDKVNLSNIHRQTLFNSSEVGSYKVDIVYKKIKLINPSTKVKTYKFRLNGLNLKKIIDKYDYIVDGSDNFKTKLLINDSCINFRKFFVTAAISKFDGHIFTFNFKQKNSSCLRCFFQESEIMDDLLNCEYEGVLGTVAGIVGTFQANEILKHILNIGKNLNKSILILDLLNLNFRKAKIKKRKDCLCGK